MSRILTITITPTTRTTTTRTCVWEQRTIYQWRATITNECANRLRAALTGRTPDAWHLENDESDEWEFNDEDDMEAIIRLMAGDTQLPDLSVDMPEGCRPVDSITVLVN
ncbi:hypothetical protein BAQU_1984 [Bifidobacterium aquikefiri]|uniref:Uncharacterized protein n=1 Tax=Bifidobacterium aquikefiri TaxID=1653207 RepID=A0A261G070_9BIFI|nr:hypothetical protein [Bifidobacterium aquikefiri]OZG64842.1 hypothetical protein BAQU_1984 [Bifidobacterium aquikefiri]